MGSYIALYGCVGVLLLVFVYIYVIPHYPDVHELFLKEQSSVGNMRRSGETAVYRSLVTVHGRPLMTGLSIAKGFSFRNGTLSDIWALSAKCKLYEVSHDVVERETDEFRHVTYGIGCHLKELCGGEGRVAILLPSSLEMLTSFFATTLFGLSATLIPSDDGDVLQAGLQQLEPKVIISAGDVLDLIDISKLGNQPKIIAVHPKNTSTFDMEWSSLVTLAKSKPIGEFAQMTEADDSIKVDLAYRDASGDVQVAKFTNFQLIAAVAAQIKALPESQQLSNRDKVLVYTNRMDIYPLVAELMAFVVGSSLVFVDPTNVVHQPLALFRQIAPTVVITDDYATSSLSGFSYEFGMFGQLKLQISLATISRGNIPSWSVLSELRSVRLLLTYTVADSTETKYATSEEVAIVRSLTGARVIHALCSPVSLSPVFQTNFYDYRDSPAKWTNFGPPLPCIEAKLVDHDKFESRQRDGRLFIRGTSLPDGEWVDTGIVGHWGTDGCFKLLA